MVVVGVRRAEQTQDFGICRFVLVLRIFGEVFVDLVPQVAQIPWGFGFGLMALPTGPSL